MPRGDSGHDGRAGDVGYLVHLIHDSGIGDEGAASVEIRCDVVGQEASEVAGMIAGSVLHGLHHLFVDIVDPAGNRLGKTSASDYGIELKGNIIVGQSLDNQIPAIVELVEYTGERRQFLDGMADSMGHERNCILENCNLCGGRTRING